MLGLRFCARAFSSCGKRGSLFIAVRGPLTIAAPLVAEHRLQTRRLSSCGARAWLLRGMWDLPRPGLEPVSPALAGRFLTTAPPGKPSNFLGNDFFFLFSAWRKASEPSNSTLPPPRPPTQPWHDPVPSEPPTPRNDFFKQGKRTFKQRANFAKLTKYKFGPFWYFGVLSSTIIRPFKNISYMAFINNLVFILLTSFHAFFFF